MDSLHGSALRYNEVSQQTVEIAHQRPSGRTRAAVGYAPNRVGSST
jgi:hypothetical protein